MAALSATSLVPRTARSDDDIETLLNDAAGKELKTRSGSKITPETIGPRGATRRGELHPEGNGP